MTNPLVDRLLSSFDELDRSISLTRESLSAKPGVPQDVLTRLNHYGEMVAKQRKMAEELRQQIELGKWDDVARNVKLINGLSAMIREDAHQILSAAAQSAGIVDDTAAKAARLLS